MRGQRKRFTFVVLCILGLLVAVSINAQDADTKGGARPSIDKESDVPDNTVEFAAPFQTDAKKAVREFNERMQHDIRRLHVLVKNYGAQVSGAEQELQSVQETHKKALERYYRRQNTWSLNLHQENHKRIQGLYEKFRDRYKEQTLLLLAEISEKLASEKLKQTIERGQRGFMIEPGRVYLKHLKNTVRLRLAYQQNAMAEEMQIRGLPQKAIEHYRLAKMFAIWTLRRMEKDPNRQKELETKYSKDMLDSRGLVANKS